MKKTNKILSVIVALVILTVTACLTVFATQKSQDGLEVQIVTDKENYSTNESIKTSITVKNTNDYEISNLTVKANLPENFKLVDGDTKKSQEILKSDKTFVLNFTSKFNSQIKETSTNPPATQKPTNIATNDIVNNGGNNNNDSTAIKTGENSLYAIIFGIIFLLTALIISVAVFKNKNRPNKKKFKSTISLILCLTVIGSSIIGLNVFTAKATETNSSSKSFEVSKIIEINNQKFAISAMISYEIKEKEITSPTQPSTEETELPAITNDIIKQIEKDFFPKDTTLNKVMYENVKFKITKVNDTQFTIIVTSPMISDKLMNYVKQSSELTDDILEKKIIELIKTEKAESNEITLQYEKKYDKLNILYTEKFGDLLTCELVTFYKNSYNLMLSELEEQK